MWRRSRGSPYRAEAVVNDPEVTGPIDDDSWPTQSTRSHRATAAPGLFDTRRAGSEPQQLVGYRIIRVLGRGMRATVFLGHRPASSAAPAGSVIDSAGSTGGVYVREPGCPPPALDEADELVALKVFHPATGQASIDLEVRVLTASFGQHVLGLTDVATTPDGGVVLVLPHLAGGTLAQLLEGRSRLQPGEAVNILAPIISGMMQLYSSGYRHSCPSSTRVMFDARGTPVLTGIGRARAIQGVAGPHASVAEPGDESEIWQSMAALADEVLAHVGPDDSGVPLLPPRAGLASRDPGTTLVQAADQFMVNLFEWAEPQAVARDDPAILAGTLTQTPSQIPGRTHRGQPDHAVLADRSALGEQPGTVPVERFWLGVFHLPTQLRDSVERALDLNPVHVLKDWWGTQSARTRRMLVAGGLVFVVASAAVLLAIPSDSQATGPNQEDIHPAGAPVQGPAGDTGTPPAPVDSGDSDPILSADERLKILGADPLVAVEALLAARQRCLRERSMVCLLDVVQENTALMDADRTGLRDSLVGHGEPHASSAPAAPTVGTKTHSATLVERSGDAALILWEPRVAHESQPISVLMMRSETGWRLREIFDY